LSKFAARNELTQIPVFKAHRFGNLLPSGKESQQPSATMDAGFGLSEDRRVNVRLRNAANAQALSSGTELKHISERDFIDVHSSVAANGKVQNSTNWLVEDRVIGVIRGGLAVDSSNTIASLKP
jgi:hypothetical protein